MPSSGSNVEISSTSKLSRITNIFENSLCALQNLTSSPGINQDYLPQKKKISSKSDRIGLDKIDEQGTPFEFNKMNAPLQFGAQTSSWNASAQCYRHDPSQQHNSWSIPQHTYSTETNSKYAYYDEPYSEHGEAEPQVCMYSLTEEQEGFLGNQQY